VIRFWPGAPVLPEWPSPPERWKNKGVHDKTNEDGHIGFGMGGGDHYYPDQGQVGASSIWVGHTGWGSDCMHGLGWIVADTDLHLNVVFQQVENGDNGNGEPPPVEGDALERIAAALEYIAARWPFS